MTAANHAPGQWVRARTSGGLGHLTLDRPKAINALDVGMIRDLTAALDEWSTHPDVQLVLLEGAGERGFCAGGDVRGLYDQIVAGEADETGGFFREEYALNARLAEYPKPIVVFADGITMGGGIGLAGHAAIRIVTERSRLAMPETRIGFTPDVGGTWLLAHAPGRLGEYLGLTGATMSASDAIYAGFADHFVPSDRLPSLAVTLAAVRAARDLPDLRAALAQEYAIVMWFATTQPDLREGIRAQLVDKDRNPRWDPAAIADVPPERPGEAMAHIPGVPLWS